MPGAVIAGSVAIDVVLLGIGLAARTGRYWIVAVNVLAVVVFLYGTSALASGFNEVPLVFAVLYGGVFVAIFANRVWFEAMRTWRAGPSTPRSA